MSTPRHQRDFQYYFANVLERVQVAHLHFNPGQSVEDFKTIVKAVWVSQFNEGAARDKLRSPGPRNAMDNALIAIGLTHRASEAHRTGQDDIAWRDLVDAMYFAGFGLMLKSADAAWPEIEMVARKEASIRPKRMGGEAKNAGWKRVEDEAVKLIQARGAAGQTWPNERQMAEAIFQDLAPVLIVEVPRFSQARYAQTMSKRLKQRSADIGIHLSRKAR